MTQGLLDLRSLTVTAGSAAGVSSGGGVFNRGNLALTKSTISGNSGGISGGGILNVGILTVSNSKISGNGAPVGGGIYNGGGTLTVTNSTIAGNGGTAGGGIYNGGGTLTVTNSSISGNGGPGGGGIRNDYGGTLTVRNSTISGNVGGINNSGGTLTVTNSILAGNMVSFGADCSGAVIALGPNLIGDPTGCTIIGTPPIVADPLLGPLADNGGPTLTHALLPGSPAIDAGDDAICAAAPVSGVDQRGVKRPQGAHCDLGAYERQVGVLLVNGDFEAGATGWTLSGLTDGIARVETQGSCFGANNTLGVTFAGDRALNVRSSASAPAGSTGIATSSTFTLGGALSFRALVENDDAVPAPDPVAFEVRILDEAGGVRTTHSVKPSILTTSPGTSNDGCLVGDLRDGPWSAHTIDTSAFAGQTGRLEFRQHTNVPGKGFFALVDDVVVTP